jgi:microcin C transport system substrate-binding protein
MTCKGDLDYQLVNVAKWWVEELPKEEAVEKGWLIRRKIFTRYPKDVQGFAMNMRNPPLDDVRVRRALFYLFDRKTMVEKFAYNEYELLKSHHPGDDGENPDNPLIGFDPRKAGELLDEAGWKERGPDGIRLRDGKRLSVNVTYSLPVMEKYLTSWQQACKQAGVEIKLQLLDHETQYANNQDRKFEISTQNWAFELLSSPKAMFHSSMAEAKGADNFAGVRDPEVDKWIEQFDAEFDRDKRNELMRKIDGKVYSLTPYLLMWGMPCERVIYWNKFGMPDSVLPGYGRYDDVYSFWWVDPTKDAALKAARQSGAPLERIPVEIHPWDDKKTAAVSQGSFPWVR